jgi:hypothetical protein
MFVPRSNKKVAKENQKGPPLLIILVVWETWNKAPDDWF